MPATSEAGPAYLEALTPRTVVGQAPWSLSDVAGRKLSTSIFRSGVEQEAPSCARGPGTSSLDRSDRRVVEDRGRRVVREDPDRDRRRALTYASWARARQSLRMLWV